MLLDQARQRVRGALARVGSRRMRAAFWAALTMLMFAYGLFYRHRMTVASVVVVVGVSVFAGGVVRLRNRRRAEHLVYVKKVLSSLPPVDMEQLVESTRREFSCCLLAAMAGTGESAAATEQADTACRDESRQRAVPAV